MIAEIFGITPPRNASLENPAVSLTDPEAWDKLFEGATATTSGEKMSHLRAFHIPTLWQLISLISGDAASLPQHVYRRGENDDREIDTSHASEYLISTQPNSDMSAFEMWRRLMVHALVWNNGYLYIDRAGRVGKPKSLINLLPDRTIPYYDDDGELYYVTEIGGELQALLKEEVFHLKGVSVLNCKALDLLDVARNSWALALAQEKFSAKFFKYGGRQGGILEVPSAAPKKVKDEIEDGFRKSYEGSDNPFKTVILRDNAKFHAAQVSPEGAQLVESTEEQARQMCRWLNVPPHKAGISGSVSYNSQEQGDLAYYKGCLRHWLVAITSEGSLKLLTEKERRERTHYLDHVVEKLLQTDVKTTNEVLEIQRRNEVINADEWRRVINRNKRPDGKGGEYVNPNTKSAASQKQEKTTEKPNNQAHRELFIDALNRASKRVSHYAKETAKDRQKFSAWLVDGAKQDRVEFDKIIRPVVNAYASVFGGDPIQMSMTTQSEFFGILLGDLAALEQPPHTAAELPTNVARTMDHFERFAPQRIVDKVLETTK